MAFDGRLLRALEIDDVLRPEAVEAVTRMRRVGTTIVLLTGDYSRIAEKLAQKLGVQDFAAEPLHSQRFGIRGVVQLRYLFAQMAVSDLCAHEFAQDVLA